MLLNVGVVAYVVGTFTLVVTKDDEAASHRRELTHSLRQFLADRKLDKRDDCEHLRMEMRRHVEMSGEQVHLCFPLPRLLLPQRAEHSIVLLGVRTKQQLYLFCQCCLLLAAELVLDFQVVYFGLRSFLDHTPLLCLH